MDSQDFIDLQFLPLLVQKTTQLLEAADDHLLQIQWSDSEANTDSGFSRLACQKFEEAFLQSEHQNINILEIKTPDIQITFTDDENNDFIRKIELKSCKGKKGKSSGLILGSTIKGLNLNMWVIFCRRSSDNSSFEFRYGRYFLGIPPREAGLFQDRTPRPRIEWKNYQQASESPKTELIEQDQDWIKTYAKLAIDRLFRDGTNPNERDSWQDDFIREIIRRAISENISLEDLKYFEDLKKEKKKEKEKINREPNLWI